MRAKCIVAGANCRWVLNTTRPPRPPAPSFSGSLSLPLHGGCFCASQASQPSTAPPGQRAASVSARKWRALDENSLAFLPATATSAFPPARPSRRRGTAGHSGAQRGTALSRRRFPRFPRLCWRLALGTAARLPPRSAVILSSLLPVHVT